MQFMIRGRQQSKTHTLVEWARGRDDRAIIVHTQYEFHRLLQNHVHNENLRESDRLKTWQFLSIADAIRDGRRAEEHNITYAIDNVDLVLNQLLHVRRPIEIVTATGDLI